MSLKLVNKQLNSYGYTAWNGNYSNSHDIRFKALSMTDNVVPIKDIYSRLWALGGIKIV